MYVQIMTCKNGMQRDAFWVNVNLVWGEHFPIMPNGEQWVWSILVYKWRRFAFESTTS